MTDNTENPVQTSDTTKATTDSVANDKKTKENFFERAKADIKKEAEKVKDKFDKHKGDAPKS